MKSIYHRTAVIHIEINCYLHPDMARDGDIDLSYELTAEILCDSCIKPAVKLGCLKKCIAIGAIANGLGQCIGTVLCVVWNDYSNGLGNWIGNANGIAVQKDIDWALLFSRDPQYLIGSSSPVFNDISFKRMWYPVWISVEQIECTDITIPTTMMSPASSVVGAICHRLIWCWYNISGHTAQLTCLHIWVYTLSYSSIHYHTAITSC